MDSTAIAPTEADAEVLPGDRFSDSDTSEVTVFVVLSNGRLFGVYRDKCDAEERTRELSRPVILETVLDDEYFDGHELDSPTPPSTPPRQQDTKRTDWWMASYDQ